MRDFVFATGIENSYPTIAGGVRVDEMEKCGHYARWREDLALTRDMGISHLRWGPPLHKTHLGPGRYDWGFTDDVLNETRRLGIEPVVDLCHFGVPDWIGNFQNADFPHHFAEYADAFARRYPWIRFWTPVNEMLITTLFSAKYGWWNEMLTSDPAYVRATVNVVKANRLGMEAVRRHVPEAVFVQSESVEATHAAQPHMADQAGFLNERRFLPLDLNYGHPVSPKMLNYLYSNGMSRADYQWFMNAGDVSRCILGVDYYVLNEHLLMPDGVTRASGEFQGLISLAKEYYDRYGLPLMHTETNLKEEEGAAAWLWKQWHGWMRLQKEGIPVVGFTWYSLTDQKDWDTALREDAHRVNTVGLFDLDRNIRAVGEEYRRLMTDWRDAVRIPSAWLDGGRPQVATPLRLSA